MKLQADVFIRLSNPILNLVAFCYCSFMGSYCSAGEFCRIFSYSIYLWKSNMHLQQAIRASVQFLLALLIQYVQSNLMLTMDCV
uniref:Uncharacterized protein n=1 Tax=Arundo donax TaxID=35708 RepID=A0A0A8Y920_ARUDO